MIAATSRQLAERQSRQHRIAPVACLEALVGAHPAALRKFYATGTPTDSTALNGPVDGQLLGLEAFTEVFMLTRPLVPLANTLSPWKGKCFESGGTSGRDRVWRWTPWRFRCEVVPSLLDGCPTLALRYAELGNPWPLAGAVNELRTVSTGIAIGPVYGQDQRPIAWYGLRLV